MSEAAKQRERFHKRLIAWKNRTGNTIFKGTHADRITRQAAVQMAHKPYCRIDVQIDAEEPERDGADW